MRRFILFCLVVSIVFCCCTGKVMAGGFNLKSIGEVDTSGKQISHWWYAGSSVVFSGEAMSGSIVTVSVDGTNGTATVSSDGDWNYSAGTLADGDHEVIMTNDGSTIKFTLTTGVSNVNWDVVGKDASVSALPAAGVTLPTVMLVVIGGGFILLAKKFSLN